MIGKVALIAALAGTCLIATAAGANASAFEIRPSGSISTNGRFTFTPSEGSPFTCLLTLRGTLARGPIEETRGARFGEIREAAITECSNSAVATYLPVSGTYYETTLIRLVQIGRLYVIRNYALLVEEFASRCLFVGDIGVLVVVEAGTSRQGRVLSERTLSLAQALNLSRCPAFMRIQGEFSPWAPTQTLQRI